MLGQTGIDFEVIAPKCDEEELKKYFKSLPLIDQALELAKAKAYSVSKYNQDAYVIGSDQICEFEGNIIAKSKSYEDAFEALKKLSGNVHKQNNGTCIFLNGESVFEHKDSAELKMKKLTSKEIKDYIELDTPIGCAGSYKYEQNGKNLFEQITGTTECVQGFAVLEVSDFLNGKLNAEKE